MVKEQIVIIFNENKKRYGYRRITKELHNNDICVNHKTVRKLMKQLGLVCQIRAKRKYSSYKGEVGEVAPNLLERHFKTNQPNRKWVTDVREFSPLGGKRYLSPILHPPQNPGEAKGLAACNSQTASPLSCSNNFY